MVFSGYKNLYSAPLPSLPYTAQYQCTTIYPHAMMPILISASPFPSYHAPPHAFMTLSFIPIIPCTSPFIHDTLLPSHHTMHLPMHPWHSASFPSYHALPYESMTFSFIPIIPCTAPCIHDTILPSLLHPLSSLHLQSLYAPRYPSILLLILSCSSPSFHAPPHPSMALFSYTHAAMPRPCPAPCPPMPLQCATSILLVPICSK